MAHVAYVDDSGDHRSFALGAILIPADRWFETHEQLVLFRRALSDRQGFRMRHELKGTELVSQGGRWRKLGTRKRTRIGVYRAALRQLNDMAPVVRTVAVVVPDNRHPRLRAPAVQDAWEVLLERLERFCYHASSQCFLIPDAGNPKQLRRMTRRKRQFGYAPAAFGGPPRKVPFRQLVDDPSHRDSNTSYPVQWADLVAHAAWRTIVPRGDVPRDLWDELTDARLADANHVERQKGATEPPGLIVWPDRQTA